MRAAFHSHRLEYHITQGIESQTIGYLIFIFYLTIYFPYIYHPGALKSPLVCILQYNILASRENDGALLNPLIQFDHVTYHHPGTGLETPPALSDITLSIQPGEWVFDRWCERVRKNHLCSTMQCTH